VSLFLFRTVRAIRLTSCFVQFTALCTSLYLFVEVATGCVGDRKRRFERFDWRGGRRGETYHKMGADGEGAGRGWGGVAEAT